MRTPQAEGARERKRRRTRGSVLVESALVMLSFTALLVGAFDFGQFLFVQQALVERARYVARWGAVNNPSDATSITNMVLYHQPTAGSGGSGYMGLTSSNVSVTTSGYGTNNYMLTVTISGYRYTVISPYIAGSYTGPTITVTEPLGIND